MGLATAIVASSVIGAGTQAWGARRAAKDAQAGYDAATAESRRQYDQTREDLAPWREAGGNALKRLDRAGSGDMSDFYTSPDYEFRRGEGTRDIGNFYSSGPSGVYSGNAMRALAEFNSGLAAGEYGRWWDRNYRMSESGRGATNTTVAAGERMASNVGNAMIGRGQAGAERWMNTASGVNNAAQAGISNYLYSRQRYGRPETTWIPRSTR